MASKGTWLLVYNKKRKEKDFGISFDSHENDISKVMISFDISCLQIGGGLKDFDDKKNISSINLYLTIELMV